MSFPHGSMSAKRQAWQGSRHGAVVRQQGEYLAKVCAREGRLEARCRRTAARKGVVYVFTHMV